MPTETAVDTLIIGGGSAGAALAGLLAEGSEATVLLAEAGPDYGPLAIGSWPAEMLDARHISTTHDWGYHSGDLLPGRRVLYERARIIGGCSAHNGCSAVWGIRADYDGWAALGNPGWSTEEVLPFLTAADRRLRVRRYRDEQVPPVQRAAYEAALAAGYPRSVNINDVDEDIGASLCPVNSHAGIRWNAAFGYLDPARHRRNLTIVGDCLADRLLIERGRVAEAELIRGGKRFSVKAGRTVLCAGTYGSPAILLRSGVGEPAELERIGIRPTHPLSGVGRNLQDHPYIQVRFSGTDALHDATDEFATRNWYPEELLIVKARSAKAGKCFDLHLLPEGGRNADNRTEWRWSFCAASVEPRSRGRLSIASADPEAMPIIDHRHLTDPEGIDLAVLVDGVEQIRAVLAAAPMAALAGRETDPIGTSRAAVAQWIRDHVTHYWHPAGTCAMGLSPENGAVVDARGKLHGLEGGYVADCSIMPVVTRANTNIPAVMIGERIASWLLG
jgi:choline dehydrogenase